MSLLGPVTFRRHYYHCADCGHGQVPWDQTLGLTACRQTPGAWEVLALAGTINSFGEAANKVVEKLSGIRVSESTIQRITESVGAQIGQAQAQGHVFGEPTPWQWHKDADGNTLAYVSADATGVGIQGPGGVKTEGRMINVGAIYNPVPQDQSRRARPNQAQPRWQARYVTSINGMDGVAQPLRRQAAQVGMDAATVWVALSDGGSGMEDFFHVNFPRVQAIILDFYHASEYLGDIGRAVHPGDDPASKAWSSEWCHDLKHTGGEAVLAKLRAFADQAHPAAVRTALEAARTYFENQKHRMDYPTYLQKGWQIGSGQIESACKSVIGARMKQTGMRWGTAGADRVGHIRALFRGEIGQWDAFWYQKSFVSNPQT